MKRIDDILNEELRRIEEAEKKIIKKKPNLFSVDGKKTEESPVLKAADQKKTLKLEKEESKANKAFLASKIPAKPYKVTSKK